MVMLVMLPDCDASTATVRVAGDALVNTVSTAGDTAPTVMLDAPVIWSPPPAREKPPREAAPRVADTGAPAQVPAVSSSWPSMSLMTAVLSRVSRCT